jgi:ribosomal protein S18 acetylase RimI-like enzyme
MTASVPSNNDVARRLFGKLGFEEEENLAEMIRSLRP